MPQHVVAVPVVGPIRPRADVRKVRVPVTEPGVENRDADAFAVVPLRCALFVGTRTSGVLLFPGIVDTLWWAA